MFKGMANIAALLKQANNIGGQMESVTADLRRQRVVGEAGGGMVKVHANGMSQILNVEIDPILKERNDLEMVSDLLPAAVNDAIVKSKTLHMQAMQALSGGIELPAGLDGALKQMLGHGEVDSNNRPS